MLPRRFLLLADNPLTLAQLRAEIEDLGEETRCQTALTAEEALFRLSQESVDAVLLLPCPAAYCLTQSLIRHPPLAPPFLLGGLDGELPEIPSCRRGSPCSVCPRWRRHICQNALNWRISC